MRWGAIGLVGALLLSAHAHGNPDSSVKSAAVTFDTTGKLDAFAVAADQNVYLRGQQIGGSVLKWGDWTLNGSGHYSEVKTIRAQGRVYLFAIDGGVLVVGNETDPAGGWNPTTFRTGQGLVHIAAALNSNGLIQVVALTSGGHLTTISSITNSPEPQDSDWSGWSLIGGTGLREFALGSDGDGRLTVVGLTAGFNMFLAQELIAGYPTSGWRAFPNTIANSAGMTGAQLVLGSGRTLWFLAIGNRGVLYGKSLGPVGPAPMTTSPAASAASVPANTGTSDWKAQVPASAADWKAQFPPAPISPAVAAGSQVKPPPLPLGTWSDWTTVLAEPFVNLTTISAAQNRAGLIEVAGIAQNDFALHGTQNSDGSWPATWTLLPAEPRITQYTTIALTISPVGHSQIFATDLNSGKLFTIGKDSNASWGGQTWLSLGKIPGTQEADLIFATNACLEFGLGLKFKTLTKEQLTAKADQLRQTIEQLVPQNLQSAVANTPLAGVIGNVNASSRCTQFGEVLSVWLDHEVWPGQYQENPGVPSGAQFVYHVPAATLKAVLGPAIKNAIATVKDLTIDSYSLKLAAPDTIEIDFQADWSKIYIDGSAKAKLSVLSGQPTCQASLDANRPNAFIAILSTLAFPFNWGPAITTVSDSIESSELSDAANQLQVLCKISSAILSNPVIPPDPVPQNLAAPTSQCPPAPAETTPVQILSIPYTTITVDDASGIVAFGDQLPTERDPHPSIAFAPIQSDPDAVPGRTSIDVVFLVGWPWDFGPGVTYTWTPDNAQSLRLPNRLGAQPGSALFTYAVPADPNPRSFDLGNMTLAVQDKYGQCFTLTLPVKAATHKND